MSMIDSLFTKVRQRLLGILLVHPQKEFYLRQLIRMSRMGQGAVQRELASLVNGRIILRRVDGNRVYYRINTGNPIYPELRGLIIKTGGVVDVLRNALEEILPSIEFSFVYGSFAQGDEQAESDIDLMVIGDVSFNELVPLLKSAQELLAREINPTVYSRREYAKKLSAAHHFCTSVAKGKKIFIVGDRDEFGKLAEGAMAG